MSGDKPSGPFSQSIESPQSGLAAHDITNSPHILQSHSVFVVQPQKCEIGTSIIDILTSRFNFSSSLYMIIFPCLWCNDLIDLDDTWFKGVWRIGAGEVKMVVFSVCKRLCRQSLIEILDYERSGENLAFWKEMVISQIVLSGKLMWQTWFQLRGSHEDKVDWSR